MSTERPTPEKVERFNAYRCPNLDCDIWHADEDAVQYCYQCAELTELKPITLVARADVEQLERELVMWRERAKHPQAEAWARKGIREFMDCPDCGAILERQGMGGFDCDSCGVGW